MTTFYIIRHAEKDTTDPANRDPQLSEAGIRRAGKWAEVFRKVSFDHIFSTDFQRTRKTAEVIAKYQDKAVQIYDHRKLFQKDLLTQSEGKTVLVVGHTNTNPALVNQLLNEKKYENIPEEENGSLFLVVVSPEGNRYSQILFIN